MKCRICGTMAEEQSLLAWSEITWLVVAAKSSHVFFDLPCCQSCLQKGKRLTTLRLLLIAGFMMFVCVAGFVSALLFIPIDEGFVGWSLAITIWLAVSFGACFLLSRVLDSRTTDFLQSELDAKFKKRAHCVSKWTLFNAFSLAKKAPSDVKIHSLGEFGATPTRPKLDDREIAEEDRHLSLDELQKKHGYSRGTSIFEAIHD